jgi:hypothetical protein
MKLNYSTLLGEELTTQSCSCTTTQLLPGKNKRSEHLTQTGSELSQVSVATCPKDTRNQILLTSQPSGETTSEFPLLTDSPSDQGKQEK